MFGVKWKCRICGQQHNDIPKCFGIDVPWRAFVSEDEFDARVKLTKSLCMIDDETFFIRGHIEIPIIDHAEPLSFSVWSSLSRESFEHVQKRWHENDRANDLPYFGRLCTPIAAYENTIHLPLSVQTRAPDLVPLFTVKQHDHALAIDQVSGISPRRWHEMALPLLA